LTERKTPLPQIMHACIMKIFGFAGFSGSGKTTLIEKLIPSFTARGSRVSVIKHAHHGFDVDRPASRTV